MLSAGFDRLRPGNRGRKRTRSGEGEAAGGTSGSKKPCSSSGTGSLAGKSGFKREYCRLRGLVPALTEREDLSKVKLEDKKDYFLNEKHNYFSLRLR